ncbi:hypothetical protein Y032_0417g1104 [Ancylostoma ceylanicum]|uniref:Uncharacterized protein n=1 Tax=Ancylostoma ceylanicum TaxID=53326 RepID=A0A016X113_9BILA|nr:hypothetical protein Y032_0417g1104 [Ancylostoma ceylanicum]
MGGRPGLWAARSALLGRPDRLPQLKKNAPPTQKVGGAMGVLAAHHPHESLRNGRRVPLIAPMVYAARFCNKNVKKRGSNCGKLVHRVTLPCLIALNT